MKITRRQLRKIMLEYQMPGVDPNDIKFKVAMRIKDIMPPEEALRLHDDDIYDLVVDIYDKEFDMTKEKEGWDPYPEDIEEIRDHLTMADEMAEGTRKKKVVLSEQADPSIIANKLLDETMTFLEEKLYGNYPDEEVEAFAVDAMNTMGGIEQLIVNLINGGYREDY